MESIDRVKVTYRDKKGSDEMRKELSLYLPLY